MVGDLGVAFAKHPSVIRRRLKRLAMPCGADGS